MMVPMSDDDDAAFDVVAAVVPSLLSALDRLEAFARAMHPPRLASLVAAIGNDDEALNEALRTLRADSASGNDARLRPVLDGLAESADFALEAFAGLRAAAAAGEPMAAFRALGRHSRAVEALYPLANAIAGGEPLVHRPGEAR